MSRSSRFDAATVQEAINTCEQTYGVYPNRSKLFAAAADRLSTTLGTIQSTFNRESLTCKTPLGKKGVGGSKLEVVPEELQGEIDRQESSRTFQTQSALWEAVATSEWGQKIGLTAAIAYSRFKEFGLKVKTEPARHLKPREPKGKPPEGSSPGGSPPAARPRATQKREEREESPGNDQDVTGRTNGPASGPPAAFDDPTGEWRDFNPENFFQHFVKAGFNPSDFRDISCIITSNNKDESENQRIRSAWKSIRRLVGPPPENGEK